MLPAMSDCSDDDAPPEVTSLRASRAVAIARDRVAPTRESVRDGQKAAEKRKQGLVTAGLRGDDYLPPEVLSQLSQAPAQPAVAVAAADSARVAVRPSARDRRRAAAVERVAEPPTGLPRVVRKLGGTVDVAVLDGANGKAAQPRTHAPVRADVRDFVRKQLYGNRVQRAPAATLASLKPAGGRFGPASNFATVAPAAAEQPSGKKRKRSSPEVAGHSTLEQMAARLMNRKRS